MRTPLRWSLARGGAPGAAGLGLELATSVQGFWMLQGYLREGLSWLEQAISRGEGLGLDPKVTALAHHAAGQLAWRQGDYDRAEQPGHVVPPVPPDHRHRDLRCEQHLEFSNCQGVTAAA